MGGFYNMFEKGTLATTQNEPLLHDQNFYALTIPVNFQ